MKCGVMRGNVGRKRQGDRGGKARKEKGSVESGGEM